MVVSCVLSLETMQSAPSSPCVWCTFHAFSRLLKPRTACSGSPGLQMFTFTRWRQAVPQERWFSLLLLRCLSSHSGPCPLGGIGVPSWSPVSSHVYLPISFTLPENICPVFPFSGHRSFIFLLLTCENFAYNLGGNPLSSSGGTGLASLWLTLRCSCCAWWTETFSCNVIVFVQWVSRLGILLTQSFPAPGTERPLLYFSGRELKRCPHVCLYSMKTGVLWEVWSEDPNSGFPAGYWMSLTFPAGGNTTFVIYQTCTYMWVHF